MPKLNFLGTVGQLTLDQQKQPLEHSGTYVSFETNINLSRPITINIHGDATTLSAEKFAEDLMNFTIWWTENIKNDINGFSGVISHKIILSNFKVA